MCNIYLLFCDRLADFSQGSIIVKMNVDEVNRRQPSWHSVPVFSCFVQDFSILIKESFRVA